jgi:hypothetical protein
MSLKASSGTDGGPGRETPPGPLPTETYPTSEAAEVERLRARVAALEDELAGARTSAHVSLRPRPRWRSVTATALVVLGCLLAPLGVVATWAAREVQDTERYVDTVSPLAQDPAVQEAVTDRITTAIFTRLDVEAVVRDAVTRLEQQGLPEQVSAPLDALAVPIADGVEGFARDRIAQVVASDQFARAWDEANRVAHEQVVAVLSGEQGGIVAAEGDTVVVNLGPFVEQVKERLVADGFGLAANLPEVSARLTVFESEGVTQAQQAYRLLAGLGTWLPAIALTLIGLGVYVAQNHRRALIGAGLGVAGAMLVLGVGLALARIAYLDALPETSSVEAATAVFDTVVRFLRDGLRATAVAGLLAFFAGGSVTAVRSRTAVVGAIGRLRRSADRAGLRTGGTGAWVHDHRRALRLGIAGLAAAAVTLWSNPTVGVVLGVVVIALVLLAVLEFLARPGADAVRPVGVGTPPPGTPTGTGGDDLQDDGAAAWTDTAVPSAAGRAEQALRQDGPVIPAG